MYMQTSLDVVSCYRLARHHSPERISSMYSSISLAFLITLRSAM